MHRKGFVWISVVLIALYGMTAWGVRAHRERVQWSRQVESQHQRAFAEWMDHLEAVQQRLGHVAMMHTPTPLYRKSMMQLWFASSEAIADLNQWPVAYGTTEDTRHFLGEIRTLAFRQTSTIANDAQHTQNTQTIQQLQRILKQLVADARKAHQSMQQRRSQWAYSAAPIVLTAEGRADGPTRELRQLNERVRGLQSLRVAGGRSSGQAPKPLTVLQWSDAQWIDKALALVKRPRETVQKVERQGMKSDFPTVTIALQSSGARPMYVEYMARDGGLLSLDDERSIGPAKYSVTEAIRRAERFAVQQRFGPVETIGVDAYDGVAHIQVAHVAHGVTVYPQRMLISVALDRGDIVQFDATAYWQQRRPRTLMPPQVTITQLRNQLKDTMSIESVQQAVIVNDAQEEVHCYEVVGSAHGETYRLFVDTQTGEHVAIETVDSGANEA